MMENEPILVRVHTVVPKPKSKRPAPTEDIAWEAEIRNRLKEPQWPEYVLVFDTETTTDERQALLFGAFLYCHLRDGQEYECVYQGIFYADDVARDDADMTILRDYIRTAKADTPPGFPDRIKLLSRTQFVESVFWPAIDSGAAIVGFNLPFDLTRIAVDCRKARRLNDGWSMVLSMDRHPVTGTMRPNPMRPRIIITPKDSKAAFIRLTGCGVRSKKTGKRLKQSGAARRAGIRQSLQR
jgi:hypothetical protein